MRGFGLSAPITSSLDTAVGSARVAVVLALLEVFGPPLLTALLLWWIARPPLAAWRRRRPVPTRAESARAG